jgi:uncharacterized membrane protein YcaP (DUF421 family)
VDMVVRGLAIYVFLMIVFRISGKRTLAEVTTFDFVVVLIIAEATQQALLGEDFSITNAMVLIVTLIGIDIALSVWKQHSPRLAQILEDVPLVIVEDGKPIRERMDKARVDDEDVMTAARELQGLERMDQVKYAVLERNGGISIVPKKP